LGKLLKRVIIAGLALAVMGGLALAGFVVSYSNIGPFNSFADRVERNLNEAAGRPTEFDLRMDTIETTNVRLRGEVYDIPRSEFTSGGGLAPWGEDLLVLNRRGTIRRLIEGEGIIETAIRPPDNGREAYEAVAASEEYASFTHRPQRHRFNDIIYVNMPELHGLALSYSWFNKEEVCYGSRVAWIDVPRGETAATFEAAPEDWEVIFETAPCLGLNATWTSFDGMMAGGRMAFEAPSTLYFGSGDYHLDGVHTYDVGIQSPDTDYGKVIAIDLLTREAGHFSIGHRNLQGMAVDLEGRLWTAEHMIRGGDELNQARQGGNYGWPLETYGSLYSGLPFPNQGEEGRHLLNTSPAYAWLPSSGVSGLTVIDGFHPTWDGDLLASSLSNSELGQSLFRIRVEGADAIFAERIRIGDRLRYVAQWGERIAVMTDSSNTVIVFRPEERIDALARSLERLETEMEPELLAQVNQVARGCNECHSYERNIQGAGPSLADVVGREIGGSNYENYSDALSSFGGIWDRDLLAQYITDPDGIASGTSMPSQGLEPGPVVEGMIDLLEVVGEEAGFDLPYD
jgi:cytochrome c2